jgi:hypothetical protein
MLQQQAGGQVLASLRKVKLQKSQVSGSVHGYDTQAKQFLRDSLFMKKA